MEAKDLKVQSSSLTLLVSANSKTEGEGEQSSFGRFGWFVTQPTFPGRLVVISVLLMKRA